jgi:hypothetical protein
LRAAALSSSATRQSSRTSSTRLKAQVRAVMELPAQASLARTLSSVIATQGDRFPRRGIAQSAARCMTGLLRGRFEVLLRRRTRPMVSAMACARPGTAIRGAGGAGRSTAHPAAAAQSGAPCGHMSKPGTMCHSHLSPGMMDRPRVVLGGPKRRGPQPRSRLGPSAWQCNPVARRSAETPQRQRSISYRRRPN